MKPPARLSLALCAALLLSAWPHSAAYAVGKAVAGRTPTGPAGAHSAAAPVPGAFGLPVYVPRLEGLSQGPVLGLGQGLPGAAAHSLPGSVLGNSLRGPQDKPDQPGETPEVPAEKPAVDAARAAAPEETPAPEAQGDKGAEAGAQRAREVFDGQLKKPEIPAAFAAGLDLFRREARPIRPSFLSRFTKKGAAAAAASAPAAPNPGGEDEYGGPPKFEGTFKEKLAYGAKWGVTLVGLNTAFALTLKPLFAALPWQFLFSPETIGRVELLTRMGPQAIGQALANGPLQFLAVHVPVAAFIEELMFRGVSFGLWFFFLSLIQPAALGIARFVDKAGEGLGWKHLIQYGLGVVSKVTGRAFAISAVITAYGFALSHVPAWGFNPYYLSVHLTMGLALAYVAYRTRGIWASTAAHTVYNLLSLLVPALAVLGLTATAGFAGLFIGAGSLAFALYHWMQHRKELRAKRGLAEPGAKRRRWLRFGGVAGLLLALGLGTQVADKPDMGIAQDKNRAAVMKLIQGESKGAAPAGAAAAQDSVAAAPQAELSIPEIVRRAKPAVVKIHTGRGMGSGFIVSQEGLLITNHHVVEAAGLEGIVKVELTDGTEGTAMVIAMNADKDIAFVQLPPREGGWPTVPLGDSSKLEEGQSVVAMGYPLDLPFTVTDGIISGLDGGRGSIHVKHLQTSAAVNHGNSGGPLFDRQGRVIAMNSQIASTGPEGGFIGIAFSVVSDEIKHAVVQYALTGNIASSYMGIWIDGTNPAIGQVGVLVERVVPGSPAAQAGLKDGDLIISVDGQFLPPGGRGVEALRRMLAKTMPGKAFTLGIARDGEIGPLGLTIGPKPE